MNLSERHVDANDVLPLPRHFLPDEHGAKRAELVDVFGDSRLAIGESLPQAFGRLFVRLPKLGPVAGSTLGGACTGGEADEILAVFGKGVDIVDAGAIGKIVQRVHHCVVFGFGESSVRERPTQVFITHYAWQTGDGGGEHAIDAGHVLPPGRRVTDKGQDRGGQDRRADDE